RRAEGHRGAGAALRAPPARATLARRRRPPRAARRRRLVRALGPAALLVAVAFAAGGHAAIPWLGPASLVLLPIALLLALDRYRHLRHQVTARYLATRQGPVQRRTVAPQRAAVHARA